METRGVGPFLYVPELDNFRGKGQWGKLWSCPIKMESFPSELWASFIQQILEHVLLLHLHLKAAIAWLPFHRWLRQVKWIVQTTQPMCRQELGWNFNPDMFLYLFLGLISFICIVFTALGLRCHRPSPVAASRLLLVAAPSLQSTGSRCTGFSSCSLWDRKVWRTGLAALWHVGSFQTRDQTCVPCWQTDS